MLWGKELINTRFLFLTANPRTVKVINECKAKDRVATHLLRRIFYICMVHNIILRAKVDNYILNIPPQLLSVGKHKPGRRTVPPSVYPGGTETV